jgi:hypothetical protein
MPHPFAHAARGPTHWLELARPPGPSAAAAAAGTAVRTPQATQAARGLQGTTLTLQLQQKVQAGGKSSCPEGQTQAVASQQQTQLGSQAQLPDCCAACRTLALLLVLDWALLVPLSCPAALRVDLGRCRCHSAAAAATACCCRCVRGADPAAKVQQGSRSRLIQLLKQRAGRSMLRQTSWQGQEVASSPPCPNPLTEAQPSSV